MLRGQTKPLALMEYEATDNEEHICFHFGCGRALSLIEQLAGKYCTHHMKRVATDPTMHTSYPSPSVAMGEARKIEREIATIKEEVAAMTEKLNKLKHPGSAKTSTT